MITSAFHTGPAGELAQVGAERSARSALQDQLRHLLAAREDSATNGELANVANLDRAIAEVRLRLANQ